MFRRFVSDSVDLVLDLLIALRVLRRPRLWYRQRMQHWLDTRRAAAENARRAVAARHRMCPACGALNPRQVARCERCGQSLAGVPRGGARRALRLFLPSFGSASTTLGAVIVTIFAALVAGTGNLASAFDLPFGLLLRVGALVSFGYQEFAWWRLLTAIFLHAGLMHLLFNVWALSALGPRVEQEIGSSRLVVLFIGSGAFGFLVSAAINRGTSLGASGAIFGLIGFGLAWGHRRGATMLRDEMMRWTLLGFVVLPLLGLMLRIAPDHAAHGGGFLAGAAFGLALGGRFRPSPGRDRLWQVAAVVCGLAVVLAFGVAIISALPVAG